MNSEKKVKISSPQQLITYYDNHGISVKSLTDLIDNQYIYQLIEVSATAYILNGKYCDYTIKRSSHSFNNLGEQLGINLSQFNRAKGNLKGVSDKEILFRLLKKRTESVQDHNGKQFKTVKDMLAYYGVSSSTFSHRKKKGLSLEECLTPPKAVVVQDHLGNQFNTEKEMCEYHGVASSTFYGRKKKRLSLEECLRPISHIRNHSK